MLEDQLLYILLKIYPMRLDIKFISKERLKSYRSSQINNTIGQIVLAKRMGKTRIIAETGAGQHGLQQQTVCALLNIP